jgi:hypothetical protein
VNESLTGEEKKAKFCTMLYSSPYLGLDVTLLDSLVSRVLLVSLVLRSELKLPVKTD